MANINLRGLDASTLLRIRASARRRKLGVNRLIVETLQEHYAKGSQRFDDLDDLAGAWSRAEAAAFEAAVAPFGGRSPANPLRAPAPDPVRVEPLLMRAGPEPCGSGKESRRAAPTMRSGSTSC